MKQSQEREAQLKERIHDVEEQLVMAAIMVTEARERAEKAEANEREAIAQWQRLLENYTSAEARAEAAEKALAALVLWKDYKDAHGKDAAYEAGKEEAWASARAALEAKP